MPFGLFTVSGEVVYPSEHALNLSPFMEAWSLDTAPNKENAMKLYRYVEFCCSPKNSNPFYGYPPEERPGKVKEKVFGSANYHDTDFMILGIQAYSEGLRHYSPSFPLLETAIEAASKVRKFLTTVDLDQKTNSGSAVYKPVDITRALKELPDVVKAINALIDKVNSELNEESTTRNDREIGYYEE